MKAQLVVEIEDDILQRAKRLTADSGQSLSGLVEECLAQLAATSSSTSSNEESMPIDETPRGLGHHENGEDEEREWLRQVSTSETFAFLSDPAEDIYTLDDGSPFNHST